MPKKLTGWSTRGRPFSPKEYKSSFLRKSLKINYSEYLAKISKHLKIKKLRKRLGIKLIK